MKNYNEKVYLYLTRKLNMSKPKSISNYRLLKMSAVASLSLFSASASSLLQELEEHLFVTSSLSTSDGSYEKSFLGELPSDMFHSIIPLLDKTSFKNLRETCKSSSDHEKDSIILKKREASFVIKDKYDLAEFAEMLKKGGGFSYLDIPVIIEDKSLTDEDLVYLEGIKTVNLFRCHRITDAGLAHLTNATTVNLYECPRITSEAKQDLRNRGVRVMG